MVCLCGAGIEKKGSIADAQGIIDTVQFPKRFGKIVQPIRHIGTVFKGFCEARQFPAAPTRSDERFAEPPVGFNVPGVEGDCALEAVYGLGMAFGFDEQNPEVQQGSHRFRGYQTRLLVAAQGGVEESQLGKDDAQVISGLDKIRPQTDRLFVIFHRFYEETETTVGLPQVVAAEVIARVQRRRPAEEGLLRMRSHRWSSVSRREGEGSRCFQGQRQDSGGRRAPLPPDFRIGSGQWLFGMLH